MSHTTAPSEPDHTIETIFIAETNTDLTEGRGYQIPIGYSTSRTVAQRIAKGRGVMGGDGSVREDIAFRVKAGDVYYAPVRMEKPTDSDRALDAVRDAKKAALERARALGLSEEEIQALSARA